jgi:glycosyltransferase involved in cell wall biosynthesis
MRVAMISVQASPLTRSGGATPDGQATHVAELSAALAELGHDVRVYTRSDAAGLPETVRVSERVEVVHASVGPPEPLPAERLLPHLREFGDWLADRWRAGDWVPRVAHAHSWLSGLAVTGAAGHTGTPVVQTYHALGSVRRRHQGVADNSPPERIGFERMLGHTVDRIVARCHDEVDELLRMGVPRFRMTVIPSGVDSTRFRPDGPAVPRDPRRTRILTVGRLVERQGFSDVIRALRMVPDAECLVVGGPPADTLSADPHARDLRSLASGCGVADRVRLVGAVPHAEMPRWYRSADVLVATPWYEPFGLPTLEAMACGVPVIGSAVGGLTDTIVEGLTGELVPARDPRALGIALRGLLSDRMRRFAYATAGADRVRQCYSWRRTAQRLAAVYSSLDRSQARAAVVA